MRLASVILLVLGVWCLIFAPLAEIPGRRIELRKGRVYFQQSEQLTHDLVNARISDILDRGVRRGFRSSLPGGILLGLSAVAALLATRGRPSAIDIQPGAAPNDGLAARSVKVGVRRWAVIGELTVKQINMSSAEPASGRRRGGSVGVVTVIGLSLLLVIPTYALSRFTASLDWRLLGGLPLALSLVTFAAYRSDKRRAEAGDWRIPESTLHIAELVGGWPGGFLAQRIFRHKISKTSYQIEFWIIVLVHQLIAVDSLSGWRFTKHVVQLIKPHAT